jgi:hypothetical protein
MSEKEKARKLFLKTFYERLRPEVVFELIDYLSSALDKFEKPFSPMELVLALQFLVFHHQENILIDEGKYRVAG